MFDERLVVTALNIRLFRDEITKARYPRGQIHVKNRCIARAKFAIYTDLASTVLYEDQGSLF